MILAIGNLRTRLASGTRHDADWLARFLTFRSGNDFKPTAATMFSSIDQSFPTGLLDLVVAQAKTDRLYVELLDHRTPLPPPDRSRMLQGLHPHQIEAVEAILGARAGIIQHATGSGKSLVAMGLLALYPHHRATVVVPSKGLLAQFTKVYRVALKTECGVVGGGEWRPMQHTIATFQTLYEDLQGPRKYDYEGQGIFIVDECHGCASRTLWEVACAFNRTFLRLGLSATAFDRLDKKGLYVRSATGPVVHELKPGEAAAQQIIAKPTITMLSHPQPPIGGHIHQLRTQSITGSSGRNLAILRAVQGLPKPCLVFVRELDHGEMLSAMIGRSFPTVFVHGQLSAGDMASKLQQIKDGRASVMVASAVMNQGIDIPGLASTVNAAAGMSAIATLQKIGRGTRIVRDGAGKVTKSTVACVDVADTDCGCKGASHASCAMFLRWTAARRQAYAKAGYLVLG